MEREGRGGARQKLNVDPLNGLQVWQGGENVAIGQADAGRDEIKRLNMLDPDALRSEVCFQCASNGSGINHSRPSRDIGRASCRENMCLYVAISGVVVALRIKITNTRNYIHQIQNIN